MNIESFLILTKQQTFKLFTRPHPSPKILKMKFTLFLTTVFTAIASVAAQGALTVDTPAGVLFCLPFQITFHGGTPPYILNLQRGGDPSAPAVEVLSSSIAASPLTWFVTQPVGSAFFVRIQDSTGARAESGTFTIQQGTVTAGTCAAPSTTVQATTVTGGGPPPTQGGGNPTTTPQTPGTGTTRPATTSTGSTAGAQSLQVQVFAGVGAAALAMVALA